jgi:hypothetical protein
MDDAHFCPGCGVSQQRFDRYPWHCSNDCLKTAGDRDGVKLMFGIASASGGLTWRFANSEDTK